MGKKSRLKRERRQGPDIKKLLSSLADRHTAARQVLFSELAAPLEELFGKYRPEDVCLAVGVSQLWLPNISSQVKHSLAWTTLASMPPNRFSGERELRLYSEFVEFSDALYRAFPSFSSLEDYVPESDWGEIRSVSRDVARRIFYGGCVERIPDFIEAFRLGSSTIDDALRDMDTVVRLQDHVISQIDGALAGEAHGVSAGHTEVATESFWATCRGVLAAAASATRSVDSLSRDLVVKLGTAYRPATWDEFGNAVMSGRATPYVLLEVAGASFPVSLRDAPATIIEYWAARREHAETEASRTTEAVSEFLGERLPRHALFRGPAKFATPVGMLEYEFSAVVCNGDILDFIVVVRPENISLLTELESLVLRTFREGADWGMKLRDGRTFGISTINGHPIGAENIRITTVIDSYTTSFSSVMRPSTTARLVWLPDFVTLFDSLDDLEELNRFWVYVDANQEMLGPMSRSIPELFASFRDTHAVLVEGALMPTMMMLDPHWASNWRHLQLVEYWKNAPPFFPDASVSSWSFDAPDRGIYTLVSRTAPVLAYGASVAKCMVYFVCDDTLDGSDVLNRKLLSTLAHCAIDATAQRTNIVEVEELFQRTRITVRLMANPKALGSGEGVRVDAAGKELMSGWTLTEIDRFGSVTAQVWVNLARVQSELENPKDARFEVECVNAWTSCVAGLLGISIGKETYSSLEASGRRGIRFKLTTIAREVDVPDTGSALLPKPEQYKLARRELAKIIQGSGVKPGRYELATGKDIVSLARDNYRTLVHSHLGEFGGDSLLRFSVSRYDELISLHRQEVSRHHHSLTHEVEFDREESLSDTSEEFVKMARNYRYLIEACLSSSVSGAQLASNEGVTRLLGEIDWLLVLYECSDVLHNEVDVGGIEISDDFVPEVFYSDEGKGRKEVFSRERAAIQLGLNVLSSDRVVADDIAPEWLSGIDAALEGDVGFGFSRLLQALYVLTRWVSLSGSNDLRFGYEAACDQIVDMLTSNIDGLELGAARKIISFLTLKGVEVRRLIGRDVDEGDVPVWEHSKRGARLNIRPLVPLSDGKLFWGASIVERATHVWLQALQNGFLPADFEWPLVKPEIRKVKEGIEKGLERKAADICRRTAKYVRAGIDFRRTFGQEKFDDVGDFDVLVYWPETNTWLTIECKYNQPAYCVKDLRRLRERIFELPPGKHQLAKIERRREFLLPRTEQIRNLLSWPSSTEGVAPKVVELYVGKDLYWWMRFPPYDVPTEFLQIDMLDGWLKEHAKDFSRAQ